MRTRLCVRAPSTEAARPWVAGPAAHLVLPALALAGIVAPALALAAQQIPDDTVPVPASVPIGLGSGSVFEELIAILYVLLVLYRTIRRSIQDSNRRP